MLQPKKQPSVILPVFLVRARRDNRVSESDPSPSIAEMLLQNFIDRSSTDMIEPLKLKSKSRLDLKAVEAVVLVTIDNLLYR